MWLLLVPLLVLIAALLVVGSVVAGVFALLGAAWPVLLIGLGVWMFWHQDGRHHRHHGRHGWATAEASTALGAVEAVSGHREEKKRRKAETRARAELPIDLQVKAEQIRRKVDVLLGYADRFPPFSKDLYLVRETATEYLPRTISAFLTLPHESIDKPLASDGRTAHQELKAQLDLLDRRLDDIAQDLQRQDTDRLLANRRFLEDRFGRRTAATSAERDPVAQTTVA